MKNDHYAYRVCWSQDDAEYLGVCVEFPSLSWLAATPEKALFGIRNMVWQSVADMREQGEEVPKPLAEKTYSGEFRVRLPPRLHRSLAMQAAEQGVSLNRWVSAKLGESLP